MGQWDSENATSSKFRVARKSITHLVFKKDNRQIGESAVPLSHEPMKTLWHKGLSMGQGMGQQWDRENLAVPFSETERF